MRVCPRCRSIYSMPVERCGIDGGPLVEQEEDPLVGHEVDRYRVIEPLGRGAMGCVYRAKHTVLENEVALKVLYGNFALNQRLAERFRREAQAIGKMHHPNVVDVLDFGRTASGLTFLVMELVEGRTLEELITAEAPFPPVRAAHIVRQIASGLGEAHRRGFVHRDMKPANVMITIDGELELVKILDFGVVGLIQAAHNAKLTAVGHIVGTPTYMAPEQARSSSVGPAADFYALGVILYEMLSGRAPFEGRGIAEVLMKHLTEPAPVLPPSLGLERLVAQLLEKQPEKRLDRAERFENELDRLGLGAPKTQQILLQGMMKNVGRIPANTEWAETIEVETEDHSEAVLARYRGSERDLDPRVSPVDAVDPTSLAPIPTRPPRDEAVVTREPARSRDPAEPKPGGLVAPSLPGTAPLPVVARDGATELDFSRPNIGSGPNKFSVSTLDTAKPGDRTEPTPLAFRDATVRDTPPNGTPIPSRSGFEPTAMPVLSPTMLTSLRRELSAPPLSDDAAVVPPPPSETLQLGTNPKTRAARDPAQLFRAAPTPILSRPPEPAPASSPLTTAFVVGLVVLVVASIAAVVILGVR